MTKLTYIKLEPSSDGYDILFANEKLLIQGDDYHDKISYQWEGIQAYLDEFDSDYTVEEIELEPKNSKLSFFDYDYLPDDESLTVYLARIKKSFKIV